MIHSKNFVDTTGSRYTLYYWLTSTKITSSKVDTAYGVEIAKCAGEKTIERERADIVSFRRDKAIHWIRSLAAGDVTPVSLLPLADDFLYGQEMDA